MNKVEEIRDFKVPAEMGRDHKIQDLKRRLKRYALRIIRQNEGALQELEESPYRLKPLIEGGFVTENKLKPLCDETNEL